MGTRWNWRAAAVAVAAWSVIAAAHGRSRCEPIDEPGWERCVVGLAPATLDAMQQRQQASNWCWAAAVSMVLRRYGLSVAQERIVRELLGRTANEPAPPAALLALLNRTWGDGADRLQVSAAEVPRWHRHLGLLAPAVLEDLAQDRPLVVGAGRHATVLVQLVVERPLATTPSEAAPRLVRAAVLDPASEMGLRSARADERAPDFLLRAQAAGTGLLAQALPGTGDSPAVEAH